MLVLELDSVDVIVCVFVVGRTSLWLVDDHVFYSTWKGRVGSVNTTKYRYNI